MSERERIELLPLPEFDLTPDQREALIITRDWTKEFFDSVPEGTHVGGHGFDKTMRQAGTAAHLSFLEGYPIFLPILTAMVMDVGRTSSDKRSRSWQHGLLSREMIIPLLDSITILTDDEKELISNAAEDHSKQNDNVRRSRVVEIAMDADRLDCLGALGPLRSASWNSHLPAILPEETSTGSAESDLKTMWQDMSVRHMEWIGMLWTDSAKEISRPRIEVYQRYLEELRLEASFMYSAYKKLGL